MLFPYSIEDLSIKCKVSKQSIYSLIKKNQDFVKENSRRQGKKIKYNQDVLNLFLAYYGLELAQDDECQDNTPSQDEPLKAIPGSQGSENDNANTSLLDEANAKIQALEGEIEALKNELNIARAQTQELIKQNGEVLLLLQEEKQEKMKLLPPPQKSLKQKFLGLFNRKN